jgi:DNA helicase-2/ATP-dependent DNA helicase PcrA
VTAHINKTTIYVASAGTGKTTTLMNLLTDCLENVKPNKICFTTFTKAGAQEAIDRALVKNPKYVLSDFEGFSTLHALCYRRVPRKQMLNNQDYKLLSELTGYSITGNTAYDSSGMMYYNNTGDRILYYNSLGRNLKISAKEVLNLQIGVKMTAEQLDDFNKFYIEFKKQKNKYDFTDQLEQYLEQGIRPHFEYIFVDEAQDLSPLQWDVVDFISQGTKKVFIAGDDKQSIFKFAGGDPSSLIQKEGNRIVLDTSYRLPAKVLNYAEKIASRIEEKQDYAVVSKDKGGHVEHVHSLSEIDMSEGTWFLLCRNKSLLHIFEHELMRKRQLFVSSSPNSLFNEQQIKFILLWEELRRGYKFKAIDLKKLYHDYLPTGTVVKRGSKKQLDLMPDDELFDKNDLKENFGLLCTDKWDKVFRLPEFTIEILLKAEAENKLDKSTNIEVNTIHATKGREADNVIVLPDMSGITYKGMLKDPDNEHRVFYVAATRAKQNLYLHTPVTTQFYKLPR